MTPARPCVFDTPIQGGATGTRQGSGFLRCAQDDTKSGRLFPTTCSNRAKHWPSRSRENMRDASFPLDPESERPSSGFRDGQWVQGSAPAEGSVKPPGVSRTIKRSSIQMTPARLRRSSSSAPIPIDASTSALCSPSSGGLLIGRSSSGAADILIGVPATRIGPRVG